LKDQYDAKLSVDGTTNVCQKCRLQNNVESDKDRNTNVDSEKVRRLETLLDDSMKTIDILERKNTEFSRQVEQARSRIDELESDRRNFTGGDVDEIGVDDMKSAQARKIVRLECTLAVLEAEVSHLSSTIAELEEQVCPPASATKIL
jgi:predicted RNase H-like nuclease (RuvC/YqgF family)